MQHRAIKTAAVLGLLIGAPLVQADDFTGFSMNFVDIGNAGNDNDGLTGSTAYGGVSYNYRMGVNEVSEDMIDKANTAGALGITHTDRTGVNGPATAVSWNEAARFVNWLNEDAGYVAAYKFSLQPGDGGYSSNSNILLWQSGDTGYDAANPFRNSNAHYFLPSEDEWYKAAYYDPDHGGVGVGGYYDYATGSDIAPGAVASGTASGTAVYNGRSGPADITSAGGLSSYGTMAQNGNVWEWGESGFTAPNDTAVESRVIRSGYWFSSSGALQSSSRSFSSPPSEDLPHRFPCRSCS